MATLFANPRYTPVDAQGDPYPGATLTFYAAGTTTPQAVYTTSALTTPHPSPVTANSAGQFPAIYYDDALQYRAILRDATGVLLWDIDLINSSLTAEEVGRALYPRNSVEISANITPTAYHHPHYFAPRYGIVSNGVADQTTALVALLTAFGPTAQRITFTVPANTVFAPATVFAAVPTGVILAVTDTTNWGQPPSYRNRFLIEYSGDTVSDDTQRIIASGHHPTQMLLNMGTAASTAASDRYATQLHGVGRDYNGDPMLGWLMQYAKDPSNPRWRVSWRLQTPYSVAIANPQPWVASRVYAANAYCISDGGRVYTTVAGGTSGSTAPTGTGSPNDGGVTWVYVQAALNIDGTAFDLDEKGNVGQYGPVGESIRFSQFSGARSHYFELNDATDDILWRDASRGLDIARISTTNGLQFGVCKSFPFQTMTGATPTLIHSYAYVNNGGATTMTNMSLPGSQTSGYALLLFANGNTTIQHGSNFVLKGAVNATPAAGQIMEFVKYATHGSPWLEKSRSF